MAIGSGIIYCSNHLFCLLMPFTVFNFTSPHSNRLHFHISIQHKYASLELSVSVYILIVNSAAQQYGQIQKILSFTPL